MLWKINGCEDLKTIVHGVLSCCSIPGKPSMFDCPKHTKIQKFVFWEKTFTFNRSNPAKTSHRGITFMIKSRDNIKKGRA